MSENGKVTCRVETWTPAKARKQLEQNKDNRPLNENWVLELAQTMEAGEFMPNGESVKIASDETLKDGQHRLHAIVTAGVSVEILTVRGLPPDCFDTIDQGKKRTVGDIFARHGENNANALAAATVWVWKHENGAMRKTGMGSRPRPAQSLDTLANHPGIRDSVPHGRNCASLLRPGIGIAAHYLFSKADKALADKFFEELASGENLTKTRGVYQLRERLIANKSSKEKLQPLYIFAILIRAWNAEWYGQRVKALRWRTEGDAPEEFPVIAGLDGKPRPKQAA